MDEMSEQRRDGVKPRVVYLVGGSFGGQSVLVDEGRTEIVVRSGWVPDMVAAWDGAESGEVTGRYAPHVDNRLVWVWEPAK